MTGTTITKTLLPDGVAVRCNLCGRPGSARWVLHNIPQGVLAQVCDDCSNPTDGPFAGATNTVIIDNADLIFGG